MATSRVNTEIAFSRMSRETLKEISSSSARLRYLIGMLEIDKVGAVGSNTAMFCVVVVLR